MSHTCDVCSCGTNGWAKTSYKSTDLTYCSYECYQKMPTFIPTLGVRRADDTESVILPYRKSPETTFNFLSETEVNQLTGEDYEKYKEQLREHLDDNYDMYHSLLENETRDKDMEEEFNCSSEDSDDDDYSFM